MWVEFGKYDIYESGDMTSRHLQCLPRRLLECHEVIGEHHHGGDCRVEGQLIDVFRHLQNCFGWGGGALSSLSSSSSLLLLFTSMARIDGGKDKKGFAALQRTQLLPAPAPLAHTNKGVEQGRQQWLEWFVGAHPTMAGTPTND